jgi:hypothetical protein
MHNYDYAMSENSWLSSEPYFYDIISLNFE